MSKIMAVNAGSSSLKFKLFEMPEEKVICSGIADRIGHEDAIFAIKPAGKEKNETICSIPDHAVAVEMLLEALIDEGIVSSLDEIKGVGHRIVQGGAYFSHSEIFDKKVEEKIEVPKNSENKVRNSEINKTNLAIKEHNEKDNTR